MKSVAFYKCRDCDSIVLEMSRGKKPCTDTSNLLLAPQTGEEAAKTEKHKPVITYLDTVVSVTVGSAPHPMTEDHFIQWVYVQTGAGGMLRKFSPGNEPKAVFTVQKDNVVGVYAYCNLHGLWKADLEGFVFHERVCSAEFPEGCIDA